MKDEQELYDFIDQYLKDADSAKEKALPEGMDASAFADELAYQQSVKNALLINRLGNVSHTLHKVDQEAKNKTKNTRVLLATLIAIGLSATAISYFVNHRKDVDAKPKSVPNTVVQAPSKYHNSQKNNPLPTVARQSKSQISNPKNDIGLPEKHVEGSSNTTKEPTASSTVLAPSTERSAGIESLKKEPSIHTQHISIDGTDPCKNIKLKAQYTFKNPCAGTADGSIQIEQPHGGKTPYAYTIDHKGFRQTATFEGLSKGNYELSIRDANGCESEILAQVTLIETNCGHTEAQNQVFNPSHEVWELPNAKALSGSVEVYNSKGMLVYRSNFGKFENIKWDGNSHQGDASPPGVYVYKVQYEDSNVQQGSVTIVY